MSDRQLTDFEKKVLEAIERQNLVPRPYYQFFVKRSIFWCLAILSIVLGAMSIAVLLFAISDYYATGWRDFDNMPLDDLIASIPVLWLLTIPLFMVSAYYSVRNTRRGYRFRTTRIVALCLAISIALGVLFHVVEAGRLSNDFLTRNFASYRQLIDVPFDKWSRPGEGYLGGHADELIDKNTLRLTDFRHKVWIVDISSATVTLDNAIKDEGDVAIRGVRTGPSEFRAETVEAFD